MTLREKTIKFNIGNKTSGGSNDILIQTMAKAKTSRIEEILALDKELKALGNDLLRLSVLDEEDAEAFKELSSRTSTPLIADIHFDYRLAIKAIQNGAKKIRINPGNIGGEENLKKVIDVAKEYNVPIRIGVNSGSLSSKYTNRHDELDSYMESLDEVVKLMEKYDFRNIVLSLKSSSPELTYQAYKRASEIYPYPLHLGVTEAGGGVDGALRTAIALVPLLRDGIGNTIRISLTDDPREEVKACKTLLSGLGLRKDVPTLISCPTCGRTQVNLIKTYNIVKEKLNYVNKPIKVAIMGCPVNGPGEAKDANLGLAGGKNAFTFFKKGKPVKTLKEDEAIKLLFEEIDKF